MNYLNNILAYTYDADYHCVSCTQKRFSDNGKVYGTENDIATFKPSTDRNGIWFETEDKEGNLIHTVYTNDEWQELDPSHLAENPTQYLTCGTCHEIIETYKHEGEIN